MMTIHRWCLSLLLFALSSIAWGQTDNINGKKFEYLASLSQTAIPSVVIKDATGTEMGTYLGFNINNTGVFLGFSASVSGEIFSFVVDAGKGGFSSKRSLVIEVFPWIDGTDASEVARICAIESPNTEQWQYYYIRNPNSLCSQAIDTYIQKNQPCDQMPFLHVVGSQGTSLSVGGFFEQVMVVNPGATVLRLGASSTLDALIPSKYSHSAMMGLDTNGVCRPLSIRSRYDYYGPTTVDVSSFEALGNLYDTYTPPFEIEFK